MLTNYPLIQTKLRPPRLLRHLVAIDDRFAGYISRILAVFPDDQVPDYE